MQRLPPYSSWCREGDEHVKIGLAKYIPNDGNDHRSQVQIGTERRPIRRIGQNQKCNCRKQELIPNCESVRQQDSGKERVEGVDATSGYDGVDHDVNASVNSKYEHSNGDQEVEAEQEQSAAVGTEVKEEAIKPEGGGVRNFMIHQNYTFQALPMAELESVGLVKDGRFNVSQDVQEALLAGRRTDMLRFENLEFEDMKITKLNAKVSLQPKEDGTLELLIHPIYKEASCPSFLNDP